MTYGYLTKPNLIWMSRWRFRSFSSIRAGSACLCNSGLSFFFFFSSRRRHTRCLSDWSSDVCSSDLSENDCIFEGQVQEHQLPSGLQLVSSDIRINHGYESTSEHPRRFTAVVLLDGQADRKSVV